MMLVARGLKGLVFESKEAATTSIGYHWPQFSQLRWLRNAQIETLEEYVENLHNEFD